jgi:hypothetical protein
MRNAAVLSLLIGCSCATNASAPQGSSSWCLQERYGEPLQELTGVGFWPVRRDDMAEAIFGLRERTAIELTPDRAARLGGLASLPAGERYYLVRSSVFAPAGATLDQLLDAIPAATFHLWSAGRGNVVMLTAQPGTIIGSRAQNIAMIVRTNVPVSNVTVACYALR